MPGGRVTRLAVVCCALLAGLDLLVTRGLGPLYDIGFWLVCIAAALAVRPTDFFRVGVTPPFLMLGVVAVLAVVHPVAVANPGDGVVQAVISGLAHHSGALFGADLTAVVLLLIRFRVRRSKRDKTRYSNREASPRPTLETSATPEEKSTTVVGSDDDSPPSRTASSH